MSSNVPQRWIWKADRDFLLATQVSRSFSDMAAFHYQQAAEKYLKAYLSFHGVGPKRTHNIGTLALMASQIDPAFSQLAGVADVDAITEFATLFRYPNEEEVDFPEEVDLESARSFCLAAKQMVVERITCMPPTA
ncbi:MAG: HEPN domain-containing protein [Burkholderiales bacterium]|nr:HEPN domain-containing protein [Burkholderiales bacterium]